MNSNVWAGCGSQRHLPPATEGGGAGIQFCCGHGLLLWAWSFAVGIVAARISGPAGLGAFALAYAVRIRVTMVHRALMTVRWR